MIIVLLLSFFVEGILSLSSIQNSIFLPLFSIMSIFVVYPYIKNKKIYIIYSLILGLIYDIFYSQTLFLYTIIFLFISIIIILFNKYFPINFFNGLIESIIIIITFRLLSYLAYAISFNISIEIDYLFESIYKSLLLNLIYVYVVGYFINKHYIKLQNKYIIN